MKTSKGKLIVLEGLDGTGKGTQTKMLIDYLVNVKGMVYGKDVIDVDFPRYKNPSCSMVEHYLSGNLGKDPDAINPYVASSFYAIDRAVSFTSEKWGEIYRNGGLVIADRYTISNVIHQGAKVIKDNPDSNTDRITYRNDMELIDFIRWLTEYEYKYNKIPCPDAIIVLMMDKECNVKLLQSREDHAVDGDIHEANMEYMDRCRTMLNKYRGIVTNVGHLVGYNPIHFFIDTNDMDGNIYDRDKISKDVIDAVESIISPEYTTVFADSYLY